MLLVSASYDFETAISLCFPFCRRSLETIGCDYAYRSAHGPFRFVWIEIDCRFFTVLGAVFLLLLYFDHLADARMHPAFAEITFALYALAFRFFLFLYNVLLIDRRTMLTIKCLKVFFSSCLYFPSFRQDAPIFVLSVLADGSHNLCFACSLSSLGVFFCAFDFGVIIQEASAHLLLRFDIHQYWILCGDCDVRCCLAFCWPVQECNTHIFVVALWSVFGLVIRSAFVLWLINMKRLTLRSDNERWC